MTSVRRLNGYPTDTSRNRLAVFTGSLDCITPVLPEIDADGNITVPAGATVGGQDLAALYSAAVALTDGASIATDMSLGKLFSVTLNGNRTFAAPSNVVVGSTLTYLITQGAGGNHTGAWNAVFKFAGGTDIVLSTGAGNIDLVQFFCAASNVLVMTAGIKAYA